MSIPSRLRVTGWLVSLGGAALLIFGGGFGAGFTEESQLPRMVGAVVMVLGIIITSLSPLVAALQERRRISAKLEEYKAARSDTPAPPK